MVHGIVRLTIFLLLSLNTGLPTGITTLSAQSLTFTPVGSISGPIDLPFFGRAGCRGQRAGCHEAGFVGRKHLATNKAAISNNCCLNSTRKGTPGYHEAGFIGSKHYASKKT